MRSPQTGQKLNALALKPLPIFRAAQLRSPVLAALHRSKKSLHSSEFTAQCLPRVAAAATFFEQSARNTPRFCRKAVNCRRGGAVLGFIQPGRANRFATSPVDSRQALFWREFERASSFGRGHARSRARDSACRSRVAVRAHSVAARTSREQDRAGAGSAIESAAADRLSRRAAVACAGYRNGHYIVHAGCRSTAGFGKSSPANYCAVRHCRNHGDFTNRSVGGEAGDRPGAQESPGRSGHRRKLHHRSISAQAR
jgi:hypothetical protein